jgi:hypothetical protein
MPGINQTRRVRVIKREQRGSADGRAGELAARKDNGVKESARAVHTAVSSWVRELQQRKREELQSFGRLFGEPLPQQQA